jgi:hypothetical protein
MAEGRANRALSLSATLLDLAHRKLDEAVFAAYGWDALLSDDEILGKTVGAQSRAINLLV